MVVSDCVSVDKVSCLHATFAWLVANKLSWVQGLGVFTPGICTVSCCGLHSFWF